MLTAVCAAAGRLGMALRWNWPETDLEVFRRDLDQAREHLAEVKSS